jgi:hypothetical protein
MLSRRPARRELSLATLEKAVDKVGIDAVEA